MPSLWTKTATLPGFPRASGDMKTDVLIIGGGMAGLLCAHRLARAGVDHILVEAETICGGTTANTTAKITSQHGLLYADLLRRFGRERARMYLLANENALAEYRALCEGIDCDFEEKDAFVYSLHDRGRLEREQRALLRIGCPSTLVDAVPLPFPVAGAIRFYRQAQFHPLKFASAIAGECNIFEHTPVRALEGTAAVIDGGRIAAKSVIVATHFPFLNLHGAYSLKLYQSRAYVLALRDAADVKGMYVDASGQGLSFRNDGDVLLLGGGSHRTGKQNGAWRSLVSAAGRLYPDAREVCRWAAQDCMTLDGVPYIGPYAAGTPGVYVATGFNKWGMTGSMVAAMLLTDMALGKHAPFAPVFDPARSILRPQLAVNAAHSVAGLVTVSRKRCPHMGCALKWNAAEHSWDCPCHGSRFSEHGRLLNNPATGDLPGTKGGG